MHPQAEATWAATLGAFPAPATTLAPAMEQEQQAAWLGLATQDSTAFLANLHPVLTAQASGCLPVLPTSWTVLVCCRRIGLGVCALRYAASILAEHPEHRTVLSAADASNVW